MTFLFVLSTVLNAAVKQARGLNDSKAQDNLTGH